PVFDLARGLFVVRYVAADDRSSPPEVMLATDGHDGPAPVLRREGGDEALRAPGDRLVIRVDQATTIRLAVKPTRPGGSSVARVTIASLSPSGQPSPDALSSIDAELRLIGHVAGRGDVVATSGAWLAGPDAPARIEGLALDWRPPQPSVVVRYAVRLDGSPDWSPFVGPGRFAGTRGRGLPVTGVAFAVEGPVDRQ
ncbi:hypothetical protein, partial [Rhodoplanes sp. SY1]|uniref:hypothetical protein n=1 Tax=Rhodoplanes sp. SY1 TaxID=3166646 RepID=UPI0038B59DEC